MSNIELTIDGVKITAQEGDNVLRAALRAGIYIPHLCSHPDLESRGGCKLCVVHIEGMDGAQTACTTIAEPGMVVSTKDARLQQIRRVSMEFMLAGHPHDCTSCRMYGRCELQAMMQYTNAVNGRMREVTKTTSFINTVNPLIVREMERCIQCGRCIRVCQDVRGVGIMQLNRKADTYEVYVGTQNDLPYADADCAFCSACVEVCPTGALQDMENVFRSDLPKSQALIPCQAQCPAHTDIPEYIRLVKEGKNDEALAVIREKLPLPLCLGLVCVRGCEAQCKRRHLNEPLSIRDLKRYAAEHADPQLWKSHSKVKVPTGKKVAVVGAGPTGLTAAFYLCKQGHDVTVFERNACAGGYMRYGIPAYRLPDEVVASEVQDILDHGVKLKTGVNIENVQELKNSGYDAVLTAAGTQMGRDTYIPGLENCPLHTTAVELLHKLRSGQTDPHIHEGVTVIVLGGGNVAYDAARSSVRLGAEVHVFCLESRDQMLADDEEIEQAAEEGVVLHDGTTNLEIIGTQDALTGLRYAKISSFCFGPNGLETKIVPDTEAVQNGDYIIFAMSQKTDLTDDFGLALNRFGYPVMKDPGSHETISEGIFAAGDCITGTKSVIEAVQGGREAASEMDRYLGGDGNIDEVLYERKKPSGTIGKKAGFSRLTRMRQGTAPLQERTKSFSLSEYGFTPGEAECEAQRCLQCDLRCDLQRVKMWTEYQAGREKTV